jgi:diadenosine tetraphosphate (Ap4A) HIT family hydrolase
LHIVPRKEGDDGISEYEPRKFLYRPGERETSPEEELIEVARQIQKNL